MRNPKVLPQLYYIQRKGFCGNCLFWWCPGGSGYTCNLDEAGKFTREEAMDACKSRPKEDIPWLVTKADGRAQRHVTAPDGWLSSWRRG